MGTNAIHLRPRLAGALVLLALLAAPPGAQAGTATVPTIGTGSNAGGALAPGTADNTPAATVTTPAVTTPAATTPAATPAVPALAIRPVSHAASKGSGTISNGALAAAILAGLIALACLVWGIFRLGALEPRWLLSLRHSLAEAGFRASATWAEFSDWIRLGQ